MITSVLDTIQAVIDDEESKKVTFSSFVQQETDSDPFYVSGDHVFEIKTPFKLDFDILDELDQEFAEIDVGVGNVAIGTHITSIVAEIDASIDEQGSSNVDFETNEFNDTGIDVNSGPLQDLNQIESQLESFSVQERSNVGESMNIPERSNRDESLNIQENHPSQDQEIDNQILNQSFELEPSIHDDDSVINPCDWQTPMNQRVLPSLQTPGSFFAEKSANLGDILDDGKTPVWTPQTVRTTRKNITPIQENSEEFEDEKQKREMRPKRAEEQLKSGIDLTVPSGDWTQIKHESFSTPSFENIDYFIPLFAKKELHSKKKYPSSLHLIFPNGQRRLCLGIQNTTPNDVKYQIVPLGQAKIEKDSIKDSIFKFSATVGKVGAMECQEIYLKFVPLLPVLYTQVFSIRCNGHAMSLYVQASKKSIKTLQLFEHQKNGSNFDSVSFARSILSHGSNQNEDGNLLAGVVRKEVSASFDPTSKKERLISFEQNTSNSRENNKDTSDFNIKFKNMESKEQASIPQFKEDGNDRVYAPLHSSEHDHKKSQNTLVLDFGTRSTPKKLEIKICNPSTKPQTVYLATTGPFFLPTNKLFLKPRSFIPIPIVFRPEQKGEFLDFFTMVQDNHATTYKLVGKYQ